MEELLTALAANGDRQPWFWLLAAAVVLALLLIGFFVGQLVGTLQASQDRQRSERNARDDAVKRSRAVLTGQIGEQLAPFLADFPCPAADLRFIGKPVDYIAFRGLSAGQPDAVIFIEVKSGQAGLTAAERAIKQAVQAGRVYWQEYRLP
ncbi:MAG TPA: hypothetical protein DD477_12420 [Spirochaetaceae bacterium]|nr:hypothetical protein [Spirochaetaceae bacterium]HAW87246.1 hypothetical protein [Spirochaetaceae bacterium]HAX36675.1 hypothetical protein [Spirochaetaceae bacterium]HBO42003.1 hypothetical protein [Spirochaetaceae bacterium]HCQ87900.1 hypothetical protein [Spirochaetaceae bacterium]